jgi:CBS domain containing-hemolysin-like protein
MIPRSRVDVVPAQEPVEAVLTRMATGHTRYPVVGADDNPVGVIHLRDLLDPDTRSGTAETRCRPAVFVPTTLPLPNVVRQLDTNHEEMAVVIDEYGGFAGIVTTEDIGEELVGEVADEHDDDAAAAAMRQDGGWLLSGDLPLDEAERLLGPLPAGDYETIAGLVIAHSGELPAVGDTVEIPLPTRGADLLSTSTPRRALLAEVRSIDRRVPATLFVTIREDRDPGDE